MTRFLLSLEQAVDTVFAAMRGALPGETYIPRVPSARVTDIAEALIDGRGVETVVTGIRPGEKLHEILVSDEEAHRTVDRGEYYAIQPMLPELLPAQSEPTPLCREYSSADEVMSPDEVRELLRRHRLMVGERFVYEEDMLA